MSIRPICRAMAYFSVGKKKQTYTGVVGIFLLRDSSQALLNVGLGLVENILVQVDNRDSMTSLGCNLWYVKFTTSSTTELPHFELSKINMNKSKNGSHLKYTV